MGVEIIKIFKKWLGQLRFFKNVKLFNFKKIFSNKKRLAIITSLILIFIFAVFIWREIYIPKNIFDKTTIVFAIKKGDSLEIISENLNSKELIKSGDFFKLYVTFLGISKKLQAGTYAISPSMNIDDIAGVFFRGEAIAKNLKIIEGWDLKDIFENVSREGLYAKDSILKALYSAEVQQFISGFKYLGEDAKKTDYEGYFFPDTYKITLDTTAEDFVKNIFANFDKKLTPDLRKEIERQKKSVEEIIIMASIIEKEVKNFNDKKIVSGILWKRIKIGMPLQVDSTLLYNNDIVDGNRVLISDTKVASPYNTYLNKGLTPGPICNPGIESIKAAIYPTNTNYLYYLSASGGTTIFSETFDQHKAAKFRYLK